MSGTDLYQKALKQSGGEGIEPRVVHYSRNAISELPEILGQLVDGREVVILMDRRTREVAGAGIAVVLLSEEWPVRAVLVEDQESGGNPVCDDLTKDKLAPRIGKPDIILAVGSGVINDLAKWLAFDADIPYACFATAASMNGYSSANVAPAIGGVKTLVRARPPLAVISSPEVLTSAPKRLTTAGLGDILAKSVSSADWKLNHILFGDEYIPEAVDLIAGIEPLYMDNSESLDSGGEKPMEALFSALLLTGIAMTMAGSSAPASGGEHMLSHTLDMMSSVDGQPHDLHGRQVGLGTVISAEVYRQVLSTEKPQPILPSAEIDEEFWGRLAGNVAGHYSQKRKRMKIAAEKLADPRIWLQVRTEIAPMLRAPEVIRDCIAKAGGAVRAEDLKITVPRLKDALLHAHEIRSRFTILDLAMLLGVMPGFADELVENWG